MNGDGWSRSDAKDERPSLVKGAEPRSTAHLIGRRALVIGAGIGGLAAAGALARHFEKVLVLEGDHLPGPTQWRAGVPQGRHAHGLLTGGERALVDLFPGLDHDIERSGAVRVRAGLDVRVERPGFDPYPRRDLGWDLWSLSRAHLEFTLRERVRALRNVELRERCWVKELTTGAGGAVTGARYERERRSERADGDLVVDVSGRGELTTSALEALGMPLPEQTSIGVDISYSTAIFAVPEDASRDWKGVFTFGDMTNRRGGLLGSIEGGRWILTLAGRFGDRTPADAEGFLSFAEQLRTPTIFEAIRQAPRLSEIARFRTPESVYRRYDRLTAFPRGLLAIGDAICRFNPVYGQGMSVAAQEARALDGLLTLSQSTRDPLDGLATNFFALAAGVIDTPWSSAAIPDFIYPETRGERPANFQQLLAFQRALSLLAAEDPAVHKLTVEVQHLLRPRSAYQEAWILERLQAFAAAA